MWPFSTIKTLKGLLVESIAAHNMSLRSLDSVGKYLEGQNEKLKTAKRLAEERLAAVVYYSNETEKARKDAELAKQLAFRANKAHVVTMTRLNTAIDRIKDMVAGDDGQAWKEAEKFLRQIEPPKSTKICEKCGSSMIELRGEDKKLCSNGDCGHEIDWPLEEGQQYMYKRNVEPFVEDRSADLPPLDERPARL